ncbi:MAG: hypothetical protein M3Q48_09765 [Actinomycetota bacterium]|nr:hypothetical protein [Actinomycetota bacterium]
MREPRKTIEGLAAEMRISVDAAIDGLAYELRAIRSHLPSHGSSGELSPRTPGGWNAALYAYDEALVVAANLMGLPNAPALDLFVGTRRLTELERSRLERGLAEVGVDLRAPRELGSG